MKRGLSAATVVAFIAILFLAGGCLPAMEDATATKYFPMQVARVLVDDVRRVYNLGEYDAVVLLHHHLRDEDGRFEQGVFIPETKVEKRAFVRMFERNSSKRASAERVAINGEELQFVEFAYNNIPDVWVEQDSASLPLFFGGTRNAIELQASSIARHVIEDIGFAPEVRIQDYSRNHVFSRGTNIPVRWQGTGDSAIASIEMDVFLMRNRLDIDIFEQQFLWYSDKDTGGATLPASELFGFMKQHLALRLTRIEHRSYTLPDGARVLVLGASTHSLEVQLQW